MIKYICNIKATTEQNTSLLIEGLVVNSKYELTQSNLRKHIWNVLPDKYVSFGIECVKQENTND